MADLVPEQEPQRSAFARFPAAALRLGKNLALVVLSVFGLVPVKEAALRLGKILALVVIGLFGLAVLPEILGVLGPVATWIAPGNKAAYFLRYAFEANVSYDQVFVADKPRDCDFLTAPMGNKLCRYETVVQTVRISTSTTGQAIVSYDEGETWRLIDADATVVPSVTVMWIKVQG